MSKQDLVRGRVCFGAHEEYRVLVESGKELDELDAVPSGVLRTFGDLPAVGDWVWIRPAAGLALIEEIEARKSAFIRRAAGRGHAAQCVAANIDVCFAVCGLDGDFNLHRLERYLVLAWESGATPVVALNKTDLCADVKAAVRAVLEIAGEAEVVAISAKNSAEPLRPWLQPGSTVALLGSSGAGKSTIANALTGGTFATQEVRQHDSRGRHTTTASMLVALPGGAEGNAWLIDTPGMRELGLLASQSSLELGFRDIAELAAQCRFADCSHGQEPGCAVRQAVEDGSISPGRWSSYNKLEREARHHALESDASAQRVEKQKWKAIHKANKRMYRERGD